MQGSAGSGAAGFSQRAGRAGTAAFGAPQGALQGSWGDIRVQDSTLAETAAVLLGRADLQDLTGAGYPSRLADEVHIYSNKRGGNQGAWRMGWGCVLWVVLRQ